MIRRFTFPSETASLALALPFLLVAITMASCSDAAREEKADVPAYQLHQGEAQGTTYSIKYKAEDSERVPQSAIDSILDMVDDGVNLWRPDSRISAINAWSRTDSLFGFVDSNHIVGPLWALSEELHELTRGAFDPTVQPLVELWGFGLSKRHEVTAEEVDSVMAFVGMAPDRFDLNEEEADGHYVATWIRKGDGRAALDFNAVAQGYTVDLLLELLRERGRMDAMVELGGEVACRGLNPEGKPWRIAVDRPIAGSHAEDRVLETVVAVDNRAICTSGSYRKFYEKDGRKYAHTIDPGTGWPAENGLLSATVLAPTAAYADALATAFLVLGEAQTRAFLEVHADLELEVLLMSDDGQGGHSVWATPGFEAVSTPL